MERKFWLLACLYFVQGLPYGFQVTALPVYLREEGVSLVNIGLAGALSLPWVLKVVWGPAVDRFGSRSFGRRRSWIVPLQAALMLTCLVASTVDPSRGLIILLSLVLAMNLFASTMDVAVDGLAVDVLKPEELGYGNILQVVGYKLGILMGGGLLVAASPYLGWSGIFLAMSGLVALGLMISLLVPEPESRDSEPDRSPADRHSTRPSMATVIARLWRAVQRPGALLLLLFIGSYKLGETLADAMLKPFLYDAGYTASQIGFWVGSFGFSFSLAGSLMGGLLASRIGVFKAVVITTCLRAVAVGGEWWLSLVEPTLPRMVAVVTAEQFLGGAVTTAMFAFMMSRVDRTIGATHFTFLATVEVAGKLAAGAISGVVAQSLGYSSLFALATALAVAFLGLLWPVGRTVRT